MELWIPITVAAAFFQNLRFMLQKVLKSRLSTLGVTFARFLFAAPLAVVAAAVFSTVEGVGWPDVTLRFAVFAGTGAIAQIVATALLVHLFGLRNFAVGIAFSKTETVMTALLSAALLGEIVGGTAALAILITLVGVLCLSPRPRGEGDALTPLVVGLCAGAIFALASVGYRGAALALGEGSFLVRGAVTLAAVTVFQTALMALWLRWREPGEMARVVGAWRLALPVGVTGMIGSLGWFTAFALTNAALVKAVGQIELVFSIAASVLVFRERITRIEVAGILLILAGILVLVLG